MTSIAEDITEAEVAENIHGRLGGGFKRARKSTGKSRLEMIRELKANDWSCPMDNSRLRNIEEGITRIRVSEIIYLMKIYHIRTVYDEPTGMIFINENINSGDEICLN